MNMIINIIGTKKVLLILVILILRMVQSEFTVLIGQKLQKKNEILLITYQLQFR